MAQTGRIAGEQAAAARRARIIARAKAHGLLVAPTEFPSRPRMSEEELNALWDRVSRESRGRGPILEPEIQADRERL